MPRDTGDKLVTIIWNRPGDSFCMTKSDKPSTIIRSPIPKRLEIGNGSPNAHNKFSHKSHLQTPSFGFPLRLVFVRAIHGVFVCSPFGFRWLYAGLVCSFVRLVWRWKKFCACCECVSLRIDREILRSDECRESLIKTNWGKCLNIS